MLFSIELRSCILSAVARSGLFIKKRGRGGKLVGGGAGQEVEDGEKRKDGRWRIKAAVGVVLL